MSGRDAETVDRQGRKHREQQTQQHLRVFFPLKRLEDHAGSGEQQHDFGTAADSRLREHALFTADHTDTDQNKQTEHLLPDR